MQHAISLVEAGLINVILQQRNLKQKFISLLKRFRISEDLDNDPEEIEQKLSGKRLFSFKFILFDHLNVCTLFYKLISITTV